MQEPTQRQRLMSFIAQHSRDLFPIAEEFAERVCRVCPAARGMFPLGSKTERFAFAMVVSRMCKQVDGLNERSAAVGMMKRRLDRVGIGAHEMNAVRGAFVDTLREHAGTGWDERIERDWNEVMDRCFGRTTTAQRSMRMAA